MLLWLPTTPFNCENNGVSMALERNRRISDTEALDQQREIDNLIKQANDPEKRITLMVLQQMSKSLYAINTITQGLEDKLIGVSEKLEDHTKMEEALMNKGKGAWWVIGAVLAAAQVIGVFIFMEVKGDIHKLNDEMVDDSAKHIRIDDRLDTVEKKVFH